MYQQSRSFVQLDVDIKVERLCLYEDIGHVCLESNPSQVRCEHGTWEGTCRGDADNIYINVNTYLQLVWVDVTFIFYYIGHCLLLVLHWIGVSVTFLVSPSVHL